MLNCSDKNPALTRVSTLVVSLIAFSITIFGCGNETPQADTTPASEEQASQSTSSAPSDTNAELGSSAITGTDTNGASSPTTGGTPTSGPNGKPITASQEGMTPETSTIQASNESPTPTTTTPEPAGTGDQNVYDPAVFDALLKANVSNGRVNYNGFKNNPQFTAFLESIANASPATMSTNERLAFWVNAYNALTIKNVNDNPGLKKPTDVAGFFDKKKFSVGGKSLTLNQIENDVIRPTFNEPLIHFGLVCAARSCPPLINTAYTAGNVRSKLAANARAYLADTKQNRFEDGKLCLSKIFDWYKVDFGGNDAGLIAFAKQYGPESMKTGLQDDTPVMFNEYDWTVNRK